MDPHASLTIGEYARSGRARLPLLLFCVALAVSACPPRASAREAGTAFTPLAEIRIRHEIFDGGYHFAPEPDRNWIRQRTRGGLRWQDGGAHTVEFVLGNEHRHYLTPDDIDLDLDELFIDQAFWRWQASPGLRLTVGRQDLAWPGGLLLADGNPLVGSRSFYHQAVRLQRDRAGRHLDLILIRNLKRDPAVLAGDLDRALSDADETALAVRLAGSRWSGAVIIKAERDPDERMQDLDTATFSGRGEGRTPCGGAWHAELAVQRQDGRITARRLAIPEADPQTGPDGGDSGWALAADLGLSRPLRGDWRLAAGAFYYSGLDADLRPFRTPWGRWPKWSDLYIYSLIAETVPDRTPAASWANTAAPHLTLSRPVGRRLTASLNATWLLAPAPDWQERGLLTRATLLIDLGPRWQGHLLWERLAPGAFHDGRHGLPPLTDTVHFLRWQVVWKL